MAGALVGKLSNPEHLRLEPHVNRFSQVGEWTVARPSQVAPSEARARPKSVKCASTAATERASGRLANLRQWPTSPSSVRPVAITVQSTTTTLSSRKGQQCPLPARTVSGAPKRDVIDQTRVRDRVPAGATGAARTNSLMPGQRQVREPARDRPGSESRQLRGVGVGYLADPGGRHEY